MALLLAYPDHPLTQRSCAECQAWMIDLENGEIKRNLATGEPIPRPAKSSTPCELCPKCDGWREKSPRVGNLVTLSAKNRQTLQAYYQIRATFGRCLSRRAARDPMLQQNLGIVAEEIAAHERRARKPTS